MSSKRFAAPLRLQLHASRRLACYLCTIHLAAIVALLLSSLPMLVRAAGVIIVSLSLLHGMYKQVWRGHSHSVIGVLWDAQGEWRLEYRNGTAIAARLRDGSFCHPQLVVLNFRRPDFPWLMSVPVLPDSLPEEAFRRLRVRLKLEAGIVRDERYI